MATRSDIVFRVCGNLVRRTGIAIFGQVELSAGGTGQRFGALERVGMPLSSLESVVLRPRGPSGREAKEKKRHEFR